MTEIHEYNLALKAVGREEEITPLTVVVSVGTGRIPVSALKDIDIFRPDSILQSAKLYYGISALGNLLVDQVILILHVLCWKLSIYLSFSIGNS